MMYILRILAYAVFGAFLMAFITWTYAATIATMPNEGGGKIVLTDEVCKHSGTTYSKLNRAYNYTTSGHGSEGCYFVEDETVVVIWDTPSGARRMRYPIENFDVPKQRRGKSYGT
jgi:O-glycosyl hydrolase